MRSIYSICLMLVLGVPLAQAQTLPVSCDGDENASIRPTTPKDRFHFPTGYDVVVDKETGLMWAICPLGFAFDRGSCEPQTGETSLFTWQGALDALASFAASDPLGTGFTTGWHLPNVKELSSIVERRCLNPALNGAVFPSAPAGYYWTSTPLPQLSAGSAQDTWEERVWAVGMTRGSLAAVAKGDPNDPTTERGYALPVRELTDAEFQDWLTR